MIMPDALYLKFQELLRWYEGECSKRQITFGDIKEKLPAYWRAITEKIDEMEQAYFKDSLQGIEEAMGKIKKLYQKAVERMKGA